MIAASWIVGIVNWFPIFWSSEHILHYWTKTEFVLKQMIFLMCSRGMQL